MRFAVDVKAILGLLIVAAWLSCGKDQGSNPGQSTPSLSALPRHASLDTLDFRARGLAWLDDSTVAVIDPDDQQIVRLGVQSGARERAAGKGGGPGELEGAIMIIDDDAGGAIVADMSHKRVSHFDADLSFVRSATVPGLPLALLGRDGDRVDALWMEFELGDRPGFLPVKGVIDLESGSAQRLFSLYEAEGALNRPEEDNPFSPPLFSTALRPDGSLLAARSLEYRIVVFEPDGTVRSSFGRPDLPPRHLDDEERAAERERSQQAAARGGPPPPGMGGMLEESLEAPQPFFGPDAFALDPRGRLWVITEGGAADSTDVDVFAADGTYLGAVRLPDRVQSLAFRGDRLAALVQRTAEAVEGIAGIDLYSLDGS
ncbi:MAG: hypothetical protein GWN99_15280 [Gemmatimonadetes bacterium]|uniref:Uncharacterized protein n=1 Tax=Candidatus Kutchimonas denitrificans TaxID=3056748 RepID=A0AAE4ZDM3_9BACT|nr:hypothetical protein [Gemmatimonadota bacterium]NIR76660.1 hypothetical protein [Candidatus Kutchimonas denitrificans]NIS02409.1 hypothetical protein [Gemmatimonadota bacterium]NIT68313.1 hypothetical protein [Gemmatimonadota bacterium]NIU54780.1 hypothetical protein [Gemmatimonadota bacterium]